MNTILAANTIPKDLTPFLVPLIILQLALYLYTMVHIFRHDTYKHGSRFMWVIIATVGMEFIGPILYMVFGRDDD